MSSRLPVHSILESTFARIFLFLELTRQQETQIYINLHQFAQFEYIKNKTKIAVTNICLNFVTFYRLNVSYVTTYIISSDYYSVKFKYTSETD